MAQSEASDPLGPWTSLQEQFGQEYARLRKFREFFLAILPQVRGAYPDAKLEIDERGLSLWTSPPPVRKRLVAVGPRAIVGARATNLNGEASE